ncbi:MAG: hypothetical protein V1723_01460 [Candidatus Uhrbacteria bacterium]
MLIKFEAAEPPQAAPTTAPTVTTVDDRWFASKEAAIPEQALAAFERGVKAAVAAQGIAKTHCVILDHPRTPAQFDSTLGDLIVLVKSTPIEGETYTKDERIYVKEAFGVPLSVWIGDGLKPSGRGIPLVSGEHTIAEVIPAESGFPIYMYILFPIVARPFASQAQLTECILTHALDLALGQTSAETPAQFNETEDGEHVAGEFPPLQPPTALPTKPLTPKEEQMRQVRWVHGAATHRDLAVSERLAGFDGLIAMRQASAAEAGAAADAVAPELESAMEAFARNDQTGRRAAELRAARDRVGHEYDTLRAMAQVDSVEVTDNMLIVRTKHLTVNEPSHGFPNFDIGGWEIRIPRRGDDVRVFSRTPQFRSRNWQHPHVQQNGELCWGNVKADIFAALQSQEYDVAVQYFIQLLESGLSRQEEWVFHLKVLHAMRGDPGYGGPL